MNPKQFTYQFAFPPLVIHIFWPLTTYSSPFFTARVFIAATSEPAPGSVTQYACQHGHMQKHVFMYLLFLWESFINNDY